MLPTSQETSWVTTGNERGNNQVRREGCPNMSKANCITCREPDLFLWLTPKEGRLQMAFRKREISKD